MLKFSQMMIWVFNIQTFGQKKIDEEDDLLMEWMLTLY